MGRTLLNSTNTRSGEHVVEQVGRVRLTFTAAAEAGALVMRLTHLSTHFAGLTAKWPHQLGLIIEASVCDATDHGDVHVRVDVRHRLLGRLLAYEGNLTVATAGEAP
jgi:hypothetical protein